MSEDQAHQFQIPTSDAQSPIEDGANWTAADVEFVANNLTGSTILDDQPHDQTRWHEALIRDPLGLEQASADVERRQREVDFNETQAEAAATYREAAAAIEDTANVVIDLRARFCSDDGYINGVKAA